MELKINKRLEDIIPKLKSDEYTALKNSIKEQGLLQPIDVMIDGTIIDGHHRYHACIELKLEPAYKVLPNVKTLEQAMKYSFTINYARRHLNPYQKGEWALKADMPSEDGMLKEQALTKIATKIGIGERTMERINKVTIEAPETIKEKLRDGELTIRPVYEFMTTLDKFPKDKKAPFQQELEDGRMESDIKKILETTESIKNLFDGTNVLVRKQIEPNYEDLYYTEELEKKTDEIVHAITIAEGGNVSLKEVKIISTNFKDIEEAKAFFKRCGGRYLRNEDYYVGEVDVFKYKEE